MTQILDSIESPEQLHDLSYEDLDILAQEIRELIKQVVSKTGGHLATNLGIVELTLAVHRCFDFRKDRLIFDVGHQCYTHKILTGRRHNLHTLRTKGGISGYPNRKESEYDIFNAGHAGPSISTGLGLAVGDEILGTDRKVVVIIGDGSLPAGLSLEGLNQLGHLKKNMIIILNDNEMAISRTVGALSRHVTRIRTGSFYNENKRRFKNILRKLPLGEKVNELADHISTSLLKGILPGYFFRELGIRYFGPINGHSIEEIEKVMINCKRLSGPLLIHVATTKGHGYLPAKNDPENYHGAVPFNIHDGSSVLRHSADQKTYSAVFAEKLTELAGTHEDIVAITAAMPLGTGLTVFQKKYPERLFDVGICEQHAVAFAGGLSEAGLRPVVAVYSTFLQRSYDQIFHDISMQEDLNIIFAIDRAGLVGPDGFSHHGFVDISMMRVFPHMVLMAPKDGHEFEMMIEYAVENDGIFAVRYPREIACPKLLKGRCPAIKKGKSEVLTQGEKVVVLAYGAMVSRAVEAQKELKKEDGIDITVVNARFAKPLDVEQTRKLSHTHEVLITIEDHVISGGFGSAVLELCCQEKIRFKDIHIIGIPDRYISHASRNEQLQDLGLDAKGIMNTIRTVWRSL